MKNIFAILFFLLTFNCIAQTAVKKKVLVIPASQFEFVTEFKLQEIATINEVKTSQVFFTYEKALLKAFNSYQDPNFEFIPADALGLYPYKKYIKYTYHKFDKKGYNGVDVERLSPSNFKKLLAHYDADFVVFITWYSIQKESLTRNSVLTRRAPYAGHYIDFAIFNLFHQQIAGKGKVKVEGPSSPNDIEVAFKFLRVKEVELGYSNFISKVVHEISKPFEQ